MPKERGTKHRVGVFGVLDAVEMLAYGLGALALLLAILFLGIRSAHRLGGPTASGLAVVAALAAGSVTVRDARRRRWSLVSIGVATAYSLCLVALVAAEFFLA